MKTVKIFRILFVLGILAVASPAVTFASTPNAVIESKEEQIARMQNRLEEIKSMDKSKLSKAEKKALRTEVKTIKKEMAAVSGGVYLSIGAIILIALLLILLL